MSKSGEAYRRQQEAGVTQEDTLLANAMSKLQMIGVDVQSLQQHLSEMSMYIVGQRQPQPVTERLLDYEQLKERAGGLSSPKRIAIEAAKVQDAETATFFEQRIEELEAALRVNTLALHHAHHADGDFKACMFARCQDAEQALQPTDAPEPLTGQEREDLG